MAYLRALLLAAFICGWAAAAINVMILKEPKEELIAATHQLARAKADPTIKEKQELLRFAKSFEELNNAQTNSLSFEHSLEAFLDDLQTSGERNFLVVNTRILSLSDKKTLKQAAKQSIGNVQKLPIRITIAPRTSKMLSYTLLTRFLASIFESNKIILSEIQFEVDSVDIIVDYLGVFN